MTSLLLVVALVLAMGAMAWRRWRRARLHRLAAELPGASAELAIPIASFDDIDDHVRRRRCTCGGYLARLGEGSREAAGRRLRIVRLECLDCERSVEVFFDTGGVAH